MKSFSQRKLGILFFIIFTLCIYIFSWFTRDKNHSYTLYRNSVTDNNMSIINKMRLKFKDFAYIGKI